MLDKNQKIASYLSGQRLLASDFLIAGYKWILFDRFVN